MKTFLKWFVVFGATFSAFVLAAEQGYIQQAIQNDITFLTAAIILLFFSASFFCGYVAFSLRKPNVNKTLLGRRLKICDFISDHLTSLGLLGTLIGITFAIGSSTQEEDVSDIISGLKNGLYTAFTTTIAGIIGSLALQLQTLIIRLDDKAKKL